MGGNDQRGKTLLRAARQVQGEDDQPGLQGRAGLRQGQGLVHPARSRQDQEGAGRDVRQDEGFGEEIFSGHQTDRPGCESDVSRPRHVQGALQPQAAGALPRAGRLLHV